MNRAKGGKWQTYNTHMAYSICIVAKSQRRSSSALRRILS